MKRISMIVILFVATAAIFLGCATRQAATNTFGQFGQAAVDDFSAYASPQNRLRDNDKTIALAAAISGGGHRAANFGVGALIGLQNITLRSGSNGLMEIDYFSTVSGGGFAAGSFISSYHDFLLQGETLEEKTVLSKKFNYQRLYDAPPPVDLEGNNEKEKCRTKVVRSDPICVKRNVNRGYHGPLLDALKSPRIWFTHLDRGDLLELKIDCRLLASCWRPDDVSLILGDVFRPLGDQPYLPLWATNSTVYENGSILPLTPTVAEKYKITGFVHNLQKYCIGQQAGEGWDCGDRPAVNYFGIPISVGVKASASFPTVVAATTLRSSFDKGTNNFLHLLDGGLSDNLGVTTAIDMLNAKPEGTEPPTRKVLIVIDAFNSDGEPYSRYEGSPRVLQVFWHLKNLPLLSWRGRYRHTIESVVDDRTDIVHLNFDEISEDAELPDGCTTTASKIIEIAKNVGTSFNVDDDIEQPALICAGRMAVAAKAETLEQLLDPSITKYCDHIKELRKIAGRAVNPICVFAE